MVREHDHKNQIEDYMPTEIPVPDMRAVQPYGQRPKRDNTAKILTAAACFGALIVIVAGAGLAYFRNTPSYKIGRGLQNLAKEISQSRNPLAEKTGIEELMLMIAEEGSHIDTRINLTSDSLPSGANTIGIDTDCSRDVQDQVMSAKTSLSVMNYEFANLDFYTDNEDFCFSVPELFLEDMYIENENVISQYNGSFLAGLTGPSDAEEFSLDFFPGKEGLSQQEWKDTGALMERFAPDFEACRNGMVMEKAGKGVYRVVLPAEETDRLLQNIMEYYGSAGWSGAVEQWQREYESLICSDISILFYISGKNRIESIRFEDPVLLLDRAISISGSFSFQRDARSIDRVTGVIMKDTEVPILSFQFLQTPSKDRYESELYVEVLDGEDTLVEMKYTADSDAARDKIDRRLSVRGEEENLEITLEGSLDGIVRGESLAFDLDGMTFQWNGRELFRLTGNIFIEPLEGEVERRVQKETAFFGMTEKDWWDIVRRVDDEYGGLLQYLW